MDRRILRDQDGHDLLSYLPGTRDGHPWADEAVLLGPAADAAAQVMHRLPGWLVSSPPSFARELLARGAQSRRHAHAMALHLRGEQEDPLAPPGLRFTAVDRPAAQIQPAVTAAFPPGHPDHRPGPGPGPDDEFELVYLLNGTLVGPLLSCSLLAVGETDVVVAGCLVNDWQPAPWITLMFRDPAHSPPGTGALLLQAVLARAARAGITALGLAVTDGNPAQRVYRRAGFITTNESITVLIPG